MRDWYVIAIGLRRSQGEDMGRPSVLQVHVALRNGSWTIEVGGICYVVAQGDWL